MASMPTDKEHQNLELQWTRITGEPKNNDLNPEMFNHHAEHPPITNEVQLLRLF